jgi:hypothetical protein
MACRTKPSRVDTGRRQASSMTSATQPDHSPQKSRSSPSLARNNERMLSIPRAVAAAAGLGGGIQSM